MDRAVALLEALPLGRRQLLLRDRLGQPDLGRRELHLELVLLLRDAGRLRLEHGAARLELGGLRRKLALPRLGGTLPLVRGPLARRERLATRDVLPGLPLRAQLLEAAAAETLRPLEPLPDLLELALARSDRLRALP